VGTQRHWDRVYATTDLTKVGWHQSCPSKCLEFIASAGVAKKDAVIVVGGGTSLLLDALLNDGFEDLTVLDISRAALEVARSRLGKRSRLITWIRTDVTQFSPSRQFDLWHDRALFHFLTRPADRKKYVAALDRALAPEGQLVIATFSLDGPPKCSGLDVVRYSAASLSETLGRRFELVQTANETHVTPSGTEQHYLYCRFLKRPSASAG
jgi:ubiquinone/menaquinone biosynthesis C-methylase UbiE